MKKSQAYAAIAAIFSALVIYTLAIYASLPDRMPIHWNIRGEVDGWASKQAAVLLMPCTILFIVGLLAGLPAITPKQFRNHLNMPAYNYLMVVTVTLMAYVHMLMMRAGLHPGADMYRPIFTGMFLFFGLMGNMLGKIRRNPWMGVKTTWTLASDRVWDPTHRLAGRLMVSAAVLGAILTLLGINPIGSFVLLMAACLYPILYSYLLYKRLKASGSL